MLDPQGTHVCIVMSLFSFHLRLFQVQVTMRILKKHNTYKSSTERRSCCLHDQLDLCCRELASRDTNEELEEPQEIQCYKVEAAKEPQVNTNVGSFIGVFICFY